MHILKGHAYMHKVFTHTTTTLLTQRQSVAFYKSILTQISQAAPFSLTQSEPENSTIRGKIFASHFPIPVTQLSL